MRFSRPCYDKPHRCPGWAGGGMRSPKGESRCDNGSIRTRVPMKDFPGEFEYPRSVPWRFGHCTKCDVVTLPWAVTRLDPTRLPYWASDLAQRVKWWAEGRRHSDQEDVR